MCKSGCTITSKALINIFWNFFPTTFLQALFRYLLSVREKISKKNVLISSLCGNFQKLYFFADFCLKLYFFVDFWSIAHSSSFSGDLTGARSPNWRFLYLTKILGLYQCQNQFLDLQVGE